MSALASVVRPGIRRAPALTPGFAYAFKDELLASTAAIETLSETTDGKTRLAVWMALARIATDCIPRGWLLGEGFQPISPLEVAHQLRVTSDLVVATLDDMVRLGALVARPCFEVSDMAWFVRGFCLPGPWRWVSSAELRRVYLKWCVIARRSALGPKRFHECLGEFGFRSANSRRSEGRRFRTIEGVGLKPEEEVSAMLGSGALNEAT